MCLITFAYHQHPDYSFIMLANRDEFYERPTDLLNYWKDSPDILAGRDKLQGGTWLGVNKAGLFSAVTNYRDGKNLSTDRLSRGDLTRKFLLSDISASHYVEELTPHQHLYGDYNLLLGDSNGLYYCSNRNEAPQQLTPGIYGLSNALLDSPWPKLKALKSHFATEIGSNKLDIEALLAIMANREQAPEEELPHTGISETWEKLLSSIFIQADNYGTRATTLLLQKPTGETRIIEQSFDVNGPLERREFELSLPPIG